MEERGYVGKNSSWGKRSNSELCKNGGESKKEFLETFCLAGMRTTTVSLCYTAQNVSHALRLETRKTCIF